MNRWLERCPATRLVIIDTFARIKPRSRTDYLYDAEYQSSGGLQQWSRDKDVAVLAIHHTRKAKAEYVIDEVAGSTGITGAADTILVLRKETDGYVLYVTGRDVESKNWAVEFDPDFGLWNVLGDAKTERVSNERKEIIELLRSTGEAFAPKEIAEVLGKNRHTVKNLVARMLFDGLLE